MVWLMFIVASKYWGRACGSELESVTGMLIIPKAYKTLLPSTGTVSVDYRVRVNGFFC